ncbi:MAG: hypothetical protein K0S45_93 [Nitrospira sp.]|nr:hypothetical protein [Nitrospira sp.]
MIVNGEETGCRTANGIGEEARTTQGVNMLTPDDAFLIHEVINDLDAVPQLQLRLFGHR